ncbi:hypothetical protein EXIGLDRAFT_748622 [Exidia glandulosa HHB12029]|uniref:Uncharacterized protein n=1 Tax=Exidia glandulosa HHB12029 TaxID=1314781 RepID=A0A165J7Y7_EXIGL|nr:hypothetical protein EXIGLDRAFT_748622 [Exidia glandulosa HHB12029]
MATRVGMISAFNSYAHAEHPQELKSLFPRRPSSWAHDAASLAKRISISSVLDRCVHARSPSRVTCNRRFDYRCPRELVDCGPGSHRTPKARYREILCQCRETRTYFGPRTHRLSPSPRSYNGPTAHLSYLPCGRAVRPLRIPSIILAVAWARAPTMSFCARLFYPIEMLPAACNDVYLYVLSYRY